MGISAGFDGAGVNSVRMANDQQPLHDQQVIDNRHGSSARRFIQINEEIPAKDHIEGGFIGKQARIKNATLQKADPGAQQRVNHKPPGVFSEMAVAETQVTAPEGVA